MADADCTLGDHSSASIASSGASCFQFKPQVNARISSKCASTAKAIARPMPPWAGGANSLRSAVDAIMADYLTDRPTRCTPASRSCRIMVMTCW